LIRFPVELEALSREFQAAQPFRHLVLDDALPEETHRQMAAAFADELLLPVESEIYLHLRSPEPPMSAPLRAFVMGLQAECATVSQVCGRRVTRADGSAYAYLEGNYLLPHSDAARTERRAIAYAYYVSPPARGGELDFFAGSQIAKSIDPLPNRLVLFEVHDLALHQVREVLEGARFSVAGWFYP
jgi:2-oxoglutarate-Fe(II)-dependent oxygenase superfamily protein